MPLLLLALLAGGGVWWYEKHKTGSPTATLTSVKAAGPITATAYPITFTFSDGSTMTAMLPSSPQELAMEQASPGSSISMINALITQPGTALPTRLSIQTKLAQSGIAVTGIVGQVVAGLSEIVGAAGGRGGGGGGRGGGVHAAAPTSGRGGPAPGPLPIGRPTGSPQLPMPLFNPSPSGSPQSPQLPMPLFNPSPAPAHPMAPMHGGHHPGPGFPGWFGPWGWGGGWGGYGDTTVIQQNNQCTQDANGNWWCNINGNWVPAGITGWHRPGILGWG